MNAQGVEEEPEPNAAAAEDRRERERAALRRRVRESLLRCPGGEPRQAQ